MIFTPTAVDGAFIIDFEKFEDHRGFFARAFCAQEFATHGLEPHFVQANVSQNRERHTLRGMHMQDELFGEVKLARCTKGAIYNAIIDMRPDSPTFCKWTGVELTAENHRSFYIPKGCAHGYQTLTEDAEVFYMASAFYQPDSERGVRWNDPSFGIDWPVKDNLVISDKDKSWPLFKES